MTILVNSHLFNSIEQRDEKIREFYPFRKCDDVPGQYSMPNGNKLTVHLLEVQEWEPEPKDMLTDEELEQQLHLMAQLIQKHKNLINVFSTAGDEYIECVADYSPELHKCVNIHLERSR